MFDLTVNLYALKNQLLGEEGQSTKNTKKIIGF